MANHATTTRGVRRLKLLRGLDTVRHEQPLLPPFGVAVLTRVLRERGYAVEPDDLNARCFSPWSPHRLEPGAIDQIRRLVADRRRLLAHLTGTADPELEALAERILSTVDVAGHDAVLLSVVPADEGSSLTTLLVARCLKRRPSPPLVVVGGEYNQLALVGDAFEQVHAAGLVDFYVQGPGERSVLELFAALASGGRLDAVPGLVHVEDGEVRRNPYRFGLRTLVYPDFEGLPVELYQWRPDPLLSRQAPEGVTMLPFQLSTVCPNRCAFCSQSGIDPPKGSLADPVRAVAALHELVARHHTRCFFFLDDAVNVSPAFMNAFCDEVLRTGLDIRWSDCVSARRLDRPTLAKMRAAGAVRLIVGLETASPRLLRFIGKGVTPEEVSQVLRWAHELGIATGVEVIAGMPSETEEDLVATERFLRENRPFLDETYLTEFYLERNSLMYRHPERYGLTNVRPARHLLDGGEQAFRLVNATLAFDEQGLAWDDCRRRSRSSYERLSGVLDGLGLAPAEEYGLSALFALHQALPGRSDLPRLYSEYLAARRLRRRFSPQNLARHLRQLRGVGAREALHLLRHNLGRAGRTLASRVRSRP